MTVKFSHKELTPNPQLSVSVMSKKIKSGVCVQTRLYHPDSLIRLADGLMSTSYWKLNDVNCDDEVAVFDLGSDSGAIAVATGTIVFVHRHAEDGQGNRVTIVFKVNDEIIDRKDVMPSRNSHYYDIFEDGTRKPRTKSTN